MTTKSTNFEGGAAGAALAAGQTGSGDPLDAVTPLNGTTMVYDTTRFMHGAKSLLITPTSTGAGRFDYRFSAGTTSIAAREYLYLTALPASSDTYVLRIATGTDVRVAAMHINTAGKLRITDAASTTGVWTATNTFPLNQWVRLELYVAVGADATSGTIKGAVYLGDSTTPIESVYLNAAANTGTALAQWVEYGKQNATSTYATPFWVDDPAANDGAADFIGPVPVSTATVTPTSVIDNSGAFTNQGGAASLQAAVADASDATYVESPTAPANKSINFGVGTLAAGSVSVVVRARLQPTGSPATTCKVELLQGATVVATSTQAVGDTWADYVLALTPTENAAITDRTALRARVTANQP